MTKRHCNANIGRLLVTALAVGLSLAITSHAPGQLCDPELSQVLSPSENEYYSLGHSLDIHGDLLIAGRRDSSNPRASIYRFDGQSWNLEAILLADDPHRGGGFGQSVAIRGNTAIVSDWSRRPRGAAYVYNFDGQQWRQVQMLFPPFVGGWAQFGCSVAMGDGFVIIGSNYDDEHGTESGAAYIFRDTGNGWVQEAKLSQQDPAFGDQFGFSVDASGDAVIVSCHRDDNGGTNSGSAYIFRHNGQEWVEEATLRASDPEPVDLFGWGVSLHDSIAVVGSRQDDDVASNAGSAYVFRRVGNEWREQAKVVAPDGEPTDYFGSRVALTDSDTFLVGSEFAGRNPIYRGAAYVFRFDGQAWSEGLRVFQPDPEELDRFGASVAGQGSTALIGAPGYNSPFGAVFIFDLNCTGSEYHLAVRGACPGQMTIEWSGAEPNVQQALLFGLEEGATTIPPNAPCAGTVLGVQRRVRLVNPPGYFSTSDGSGTLQGEASTGACGGFLQLVQGSDCATSNVVQVP